MEYWEFLLQKKGDRSWLPLESSNVEILEGRYRIVARSSRKDTPVEIQIRHTSPEDVPPRWRTKSRAGHTNNSGLVSIVPFVHFRPGTWELRCTNDLMSDFVGERWLYSVKLQVVAQEDLLDDDWSGPVVDTASPGLDAGAASPAEDESDLPPLPAGFQSDLPDLPFAADQSAQDDIQTDVQELDVQAAELQEDEALVSAEAVPEEDEPGSSILDQSAQSNQSAQDIAIEPSEANWSDFESGDIDAESAAPAPARSQFESAPDPAPEPAIADSALDLNRQSNADTDWDGAVPLSETSMPYDSLPTHGDLRTLAEQMSQDIVDEAFLDVESAIDPQRDVARSQAINRNRTLPSEATGIFKLADQPVRLQLQTDAYIVKGSRPVQLTGAIALTDSSADSSADPIDSPQLPGSVLTIRLFDPQTAQTIDQIQQPVSAQPLPATFRVAIAPPAHRSHLILGEVTLSTEIGGQILAAESQEFSITTDLNELLDAIANQDTALDAESAESVELFNFDAPPVDVTAPSSRSDDESSSVAAEDEAASSEAAAKRKIDFSAPPAIPFQPSRFQPQVGMALPPQIRASASSPANPEPAENPVDSSPPSQSAPPPPTPAPSRFEPLLPKFPALRSTPSDMAAQANTGDVASMEQEDPSLDAVSAAEPVQDERATGQISGNLHGQEVAAVDDLADAAADAVTDSLADPDEADPDKALTMGDMLQDSSINADAHPQESTPATPEAAVTEVDELESAADEQPPILADQSDPHLDNDADDLADIDADWAADADDTADVGVDQTLDSTDEEPTFDLDISAESTPVNPLDQSFLSLNLQDRFFSRLSALAFDAQAAQMQQIEDSTAYRPHGVDFDALNEFQSFSPEAESRTNGHDAASLPAEALLPDFDSSPTAEDLAREAELTAHEVVIYDDDIVVDDVSVDDDVDPDPAIADPATYPAANSSNLSDTIEPDIDSWSNLPPLPVPQLKIPAGDLKADEPIDVQVRLPVHPLRVYVKFWMSDRQMRTILDGPRWLADLEPDGQGSLQTVVQLVVPKGCLEVQIEAVTVEVATQRQSQKASFNRTVLPVDLPTVSFDEFDLP